MTDLQYIRNNRQDHGASDQQQRDEKPAKQDAAQGNATKNPIALPEHSSKTLQRWPRPAVASHPSQLNECLDVKSLRKQIEEMDLA